MICLFGLVVIPLILIVACEHSEKLDRVLGLTGEIYED